MLYVESGVRFTLEYGDIDEPFYNSIVSVYAEIVKGLNSQETDEWFSVFRPRMEKIITQAETVGWWFEENLADTYEEIRWHEEEK